MQASIRRVLVIWLLEFKWCCLDKCQGLLLLDITEVSVENMLQQLVLSPEHLNRQQPLSWPPISEGCGGSDTATLWYHTKILEYSAQWSLKTSALSMWLSLLWGVNLHVGSNSGASPVHVWRRHFVQCFFCVVGGSFFLFRGDRGTE